MYVTANFPAGEAYTLDVPETFDPTPDTNGVVTLAGRPRAINFIAYSRRPDPATDLALRHRFDVMEGVFRVEIYETKDVPPETLRAYWRFPKGTLATFLQDDSGCDHDDLAVGMRMIIANAGVSLSRFGLPVVSPRQPLRSGDPRNPFEREMLILSPVADKEGPVTVIKLQREPSWIAESQRTERWRDMSATAVTTSVGVTVSAAGKTTHERDIDQAARTMAESLVPVR